jgi:Cupin domain
MAVQRAPGISRTDLQEHDLSIPGYEVIQNRVDIGPQAPFVRHKHPGEEIIYVLEGSLEYAIDGQTPKTYSAGEGLDGSSRHRSRREERRKRQRIGARHVRRREGEAVPGGRRMSAAVVGS